MRSSYTADRSELSSKRDRYVSVPRQSMPQKAAADCAEAVWSSLEMDLASSSEALDELWLGLAID